jgi:spore coat polysaccharide biosynthesis protein SpsF
MTTAAIVQARMSSTRLPGKVLRKLGDATVLHHVLSRCAAVPGCDVVVCAIPEGNDCEPIAKEAEAAGAVVVRGSETDVLDRYYKSAQAVHADVILRVTSDCPLIDPVVCGNVLALRKSESADYACNNMPSSFPHGLDCEAFTMSALTKAAQAATDAADREHVTPWLRREAGVKRANLSASQSEYADQRWTLDYPEDYEFFRAVWGAMDQSGVPSWKEVAALVASRPDISSLNAIRRPARPA